MPTPKRPIDIAVSDSAKETAGTPVEERRAATRIAGKTPVFLLWLLGLPIPIILIIYLLKGCS